MTTAPTASLTPEPLSDADLVRQAAEVLTNRWTSREECYRLADALHALAATMEQAVSLSAVVNALRSACHNNPVNVDAWAKEHNLPDEYVFKVSIETAEPNEEICRALGFERVEPKYKRLEQKTNES